MPWFWGTLAPSGMVLGNQVRGSKVTVRNPLWFSYPGYSEMLTGQPQPDVLSNDLVRYPHQTVLDYAHRNSDSPTEVAQISSWIASNGRRAAAFFMSGASNRCQWPQHAGDGSVGRVRQESSALG
jgi:hypothetical protein